MSLQPRFQIAILDIILLTTLVAGIVAGVGAREPDIAFIVASCLGLFIWHRPVVAQLWVTGMIGLGAGLFAAGMHGRHDMIMLSGDMVGWGAGMVVGGFTYLFVTRQLRQLLAAEQANRSRGGES
jgi:hypothetical protein